jgi:hypothetical protein
MLGVLLLGRRIGTNGFYLSAIVPACGVLYSNLTARTGFLPPSFYLGMVGVVLFGMVGLLASLSIRGGLVPLLFGR